MLRFAAILGFMLMLTGVTAGQAAESRACSDADWEALVSLEDEYYELLKRSLYLRSEEKLIEAARAHVEWRDELLPRLPDCREAHELGIAMVQMLGDGIVTSVYESFFGVSQSENPLTPALKEGSTRIYLLYLREAEADAAATGAAAVDGQFCSLHDTGADYDLNAGYGELLGILETVNSVQTLLELAAAQVAWRAQLLRQLSICSEVYDTAYMLSHLTSDLVAYISFLGVGIDADSIPYLDAITSAQSALQDFYHAQAIQQVPEHVSPLRVNLPACGAEALAGISRGKHSYMDLIFKMNEGVYSNAELISYAEAMLAWRDSYLPTVPACEEAVAAALLETWLAADFIGETVLQWARVPASDNLYAEWRATSNARLSDLAATIQSADATAAPETTKSLPACDAEQLDAVFGYMLTNIRNLSENADAISNAGGLIGYGAHQKMWRSLVWPNLLMCSESIALAMLMNQHAIDAGSYHALRLVGVDDASNPFLERLKTYEDHYAELAAAAGRDL